MPSMGVSGIILVVILGLLLFGPSKLPELGRAFGKTLREFKKGASGILDDEDLPKAQETSVQTGATAVAGASAQEATAASTTSKRLPE